MVLIADRSLYRVVLVGNFTVNCTIIRTNGHWLRQNVYSDV